MADQLAENIRKLHDLHADGVLDDDEYTQKLAKLRKQHGDAAVDKRLKALSIVETTEGHQQDIAGQAQVGVAVAGNINGNVTVYFTAAGINEPSDEQREVLASYLRRLAERCDRLRLSGAVRRERRDAAPALTLSQVYVTLAAQSRVLLAEADSEDAFADDLAAGDPDVVTPDAARYVVPGHPDLRAGRMAEPEQTSYRLERPLLLTEALSQRRRLVLLGGPGSGKSSFLRHLAVSLAHAPDQADPALPGWSAGRLLPLYVSLGAFAAWCREAERSIDGPHLWQYLLTTAQEYGLDGLDAQVRRAFRNGGMLVLLDGLDEVAEPALRSQVARAVAALADATTYVAVTCRVRSFDETLAEVFAGWGAPVDLAPFTLGQMRQFVAGWYGRSAESGAIDAAEAAERSDELIERLAAVPALRDLSQTPLLLTIMTILHYYEGKLPEDRAELYEDLVQLFLNRWTQYRREAGAPLPLLQQLKANGQLGGLKDYHLRTTLEALAYDAHQEAPCGDGRGLLDEHRVRGAFQKLFADFDIGVGPAAEKADLVLRHLDDESGLVLNEGGGRYGLPHLSYEEYLAGCHLAQQAAFETLAYQHWRADPGRWREVIFLALGTMVQGTGRETAARWLRFLSERVHGDQVRDADDYEQAIFFAGECLAEMGGKAALINVTTVPLADLWAQLAQGLVQVLGSQTIAAADRVRAGVWLGELGDPRAGVGDLPPAMVDLPGGSFTIGDDDEAATLELAPFAIGQYPVTNAQYARFIEAGGYDPAAEWWDEAGRAWLTSRGGRAEPSLWHDPRFGISRPNHPVVGVSWYEAMAFCRWLTAYLNDGAEYRLPSEAEWEYAARGAEQREYPWGSAEPDVERANYEEIYNGTTAAGCFPTGATPEGIHDLAGNAREWTRSIYRDYPYDPADGRENTSDPAGKRLTNRGGGWDYHPVILRAALRSHFSPDYRYDSLGFRLARHFPV